MHKKRTVILFCVGAVLLCVGIFAIVYSGNSANANVASYEEMNRLLNDYSPTPFVNRSAQTPSIQADNTEEALYTYKSPEGFLFVSHSESWDESGLRLLYEELLKNHHGKEIETLHEVIIHPEKDDLWGGVHVPSSLELFLTISFGVFPDGFQLCFPKNVSSIELYGGDYYTTVESMARTLSHEYGHLFTYYYFFNPAFEASASFSDEDTKAALLKTEYAELRGAEGLDLIADTFFNLESTEYSEQHYRYLVEVAAEDYVQLMGSSTTRYIVDFPDIRESLNGAEYPDEFEQQAAANVRPQENMLIPMASEVPGLADYFYSMIGELPSPMPQKQEITIDIESHSVGYNLIDGYKTFINYSLNWNAPYDNAGYTIVCYDPDASYYIRPIKTVFPGESSSATIGTVTWNNGSSVSWQYDEIDSGTKVFYVIAQLPDGTFYLSSPLEYSF